MDFARYKLTQPRFINGHLYRPTDGYDPIIEVPEDFPAGMGMEPLNAAAERAVERWYEKVGAKPPPSPPVVVREIQQRPVTDEEPTLRPIGPPDHLSPPVAPVPLKTGATHTPDPKVPPNKVDLQTKSGSITNPDPKGPPPPKKLDHPVNPAPLPGTEKLTVPANPPLAKDGSNTE